MSYSTIRRFVMSELQRASDCTILDPYTVVMFYTRSWLAWRSYFLLSPWSWIWNIATWIKYSEYSRDALDVSRRIDLALELPERVLRVAQLSLEAGALLAELEPLLVRVSLARASLAMLAHFLLVCSAHWLELALLPSGRLSRKFLAAAWDLTVLLEENPVQRDSLTTHTNRAMSIRQKPMRVSKANQSNSQSAHLVLALRIIAIGDVRGDIRCVTHKHVLTHVLQSALGVWRHSGTQLHHVDEHSHAVGRNLAPSSAAVAHST